VRSRPFAHRAKRRFRRVAGEHFVRIREWQCGGAVNLADANSDGAIWARLSLALLINRHCAEFWDDDTVSRQLQRLRNLRMPWSTGD